MGNGLDFLHGVETQEVINAGQTIQTATSSIIGLLGTAGKGDYNVPSLCAGNPREAVQKFGVFAADGFTIPEAISGIFDQIGAMVVVVNVCDPTRHVTNVLNEAIGFDRNFHGVTAHPYVSALTLGTAWSALVGVGAAGIIMPAGAVVTDVEPVIGGTPYIKDTDYTVTIVNGVSTILAKAGGAFPAAGARVIVDYTATPVVNVDYTVAPDTGTITRINAGLIMNLATGTVSYTYVDPTKVTNVDIFGGTDVFGNYIGAHAFLGSEDRLALTPRILIAPHFTHQKANAITANPVVSELLSVAKEIKAVIYQDGPDTTDEDAIAMRNDWGSDRIMIVDPWAKIVGPNGADWLVPASVYWAGITAQTDNAIGFWASPSNKEIAGIIGAGRTVDFRMGSTTCRANYLNANQVSTIIRKKGYRTWGNHSCSIEPATSFLTARRTADMIEESIQEAHLWAVDRVISKTYLQDVLENVSAYLRHLRQVGAIYGGSAWIDRALNSDDVIADGHVYINYDFTCPKTAEHITFIASITDAYISNIFQALSLALSNTSVINVTPVVGTGR
jgi:phage tail sheath protein FI